MGSPLRTVIGGVGSSLKQTVKDIPENIWSTRKENIKKKKWIYSMLGSSQNRKIIERELTVGGTKPSDAEVQKVIDERWRNLQSVSVSIADEPIGRSWESTYGIYEPPKKEGIKNLKEYYKRVKGVDISIEEAKEIWEKQKKEGKIGKEHHITLQPQDKYFHKDVNLEEYLHAVKGGPKGGRIPEKTLDLIDKHAIGGIGSQYVTIPDEFTVQFNSVKYKMEEKGLYNPMEEDFTEEHYNKLMEGDHRIRMSNHFDRMMRSLKENYNDKGRYIGPGSDDNYLQTDEQKEKVKKAVIKLMNNISVKVDESKDDKQTWASIGKEAYMGGV